MGEDALRRVGNGGAALRMIRMGRRRLRSLPLGAPFLSPFLKLEGIRGVVRLWHKSIRRMIPINERTGT